MQSKKLILFIVAVIVSVIITVLIIFFTSGKGKPKRVTTPPPRVNSSDLPVPIHYYSDEIYNPTLDLDLRPLKDNLLGFTVSEMTLNSIWFAPSKNLSVFTANGMYLVDKATCTGPYPKMNGFMISDSENLVMKDIAGTSERGLDYYRYADSQLFSGPTDFGNCVGHNCYFNIGNVYSYQPITLGNFLDLGDTSVYYSIELSDVGTIGNIQAPVLLDLQIVDNPVLSSIGSISSPQIGDFNIFNNPLLTTIGSMSSGVFIDGSNFNLTGNSLSSACISQLFSEWDLSGASNCICDLTGGTNATEASFTPSGATAKSNLITKGWNFAMN
jgi:hypothetical protein